MNPRTPKMCPICARPATQLNDEPATNIYYVACRKCGKFSLSGLEYETFFELHNSDSTEKVLLPYLSAYTRHATERGERIFLDNENWKEDAAAYAHTSVGTKLIRFLEIVALRSNPGKSGRLDRIEDGSLLDAFDSDEVIFLANTLHQRELINFAGDDFYALTAKGWEQIQTGTINGIPGKCFIAMSFDKSLTEAFKEGISPAVKRTVIWSR